MSRKASSTKQHLHCASALIKITERELVGGEESAFPFPADLSFGKNYA